MSNETDLARYQLANGNTLRIVRDDSPESPREWSNLGKLFLFSNKNGNIDEFENEIDLENCKDWEDISEKFREMYEGCIIKNVYVYEHGNVVYRTTPFGCPFDSWQAGLIVCTPEDAKTAGFDPIKDAEKIEKGLISEVVVFSMWRNGEIYGFIEEDQNGDHVNSCFGFYGSDPKENGMVDHLDSEIIEI